MRSFENGFLLRITRENEGVFVTTDGLTMRDFDDVATAVRKVLANFHRGTAEERRES